MPLWPFFALMYVKVTTTNKSYNPHKQRKVNSLLFVTPKIHVVF